MSQHNRNTTLGKWLTDFGDEMLSWATYKTSSKETAEDLVQDSFLSAFKAFDSFKEGTNPKTWLFTILNNKIIDYYRSGNTKKMITESRLKSDQVESEFFDDNGAWAKQESFNLNEDGHLLDNPEFISVFESCINNLPPNWQTVIKSKYVENKKGNLIRKEMEISASNMWQMVHRAKLQLKKCLDINWKAT